MIKANENKLLSKKEAYLCEMKPEFSVIISTYNAVDWLEKVLWGYAQQTFMAFELIIADDGSTSETADLLSHLGKKLKLDIKHIWQADEGFQKSRILNKALLTCSTNYVVMSDGDCIPRADFLETHFSHKKPKHFLSGGYFKLPLSISNHITAEHIVKQSCFDIEWLKANGLPAQFKNNKLKVRGHRQHWFNTLTPTKATWNGHNASGWKADLMAVNGFDERMQYGGQDRELGERLVNLGIRPIQIRYSAICVHLDHKRGYAQPKSIAKNKKIRQETRNEKKIWTDYGIQK